MKADGVSNTLLHALPMLYLAPLSANSPPVTIGRRMQAVKADN
jgi:hypothetical protein